MKLMGKLAIGVLLIGINTIASPFYLQVHSTSVQVVYFAFGIMVVGISIIMFIHERTFADLDKQLDDKSQKAEART